MSALKNTPLVEYHIELGAKMVPHAGWNMPQQYPEGTELEKGTAVSYKVSKGEKPSESGSEDFGDGTESADE